MPGGAGAAVSGNVVITFNEAMDAAPGTVKLNDLAALSGGAWSADKTVFTIPYSGLAAGTNYTVNISGFKDTAGNVMAANSSNSFSTGTADTTPPTVLSVTPGGTEASASGNVAITFNEAMNNAAPGTVKLNTTELSGGAWSAGNTVFTVPYGPLALGATYTVNISGFKDAAGNVMLADSGNSFSTKAIRAGLYAKAPEAITGNDTPIDVSAQNGANTYEKAIAYAKSNAAAVYTLVLDGNVSVAGGTASSTDATRLNTGSAGSPFKLWLVGTGGQRTISLSSAGRLFTVDANNTLALGANITLAGISANTAPVVYVNGGTLEINDGAVISGNTSSGNGGGGVSLIGATASFTMNGGEIKNNTSSYTYGTGGVSANNIAAFTMKGGKITGNTATYGGVSISTATAIAAITGGEISGNNGTSAAGLYISDTTAPVTMSGGEIKGNTGTNSSGAGGVFVSPAAAFNLSGGKITGNTGCGVVVSGTFTMGGGEISNNTMGGAAAGVRLTETAKFTMTGGEIKGNTSTNGSSGGGVYVGSSATFTMTGGEIKGNSVTNDSNSIYARGGGVYVASGTSSSGLFRIVTGTIYGSNADEGLKNTAAGNPAGAALYVATGTVNGVAQRGTFGGADGAWVSNGPINTTGENVETTVKILNGNPVQ